MIPVRAEFADIAVDRRATHHAGLGATLGLCLGLLAAGAAVIGLIVFIVLVAAPGAGAAGGCGGA